MIDKQEIINRLDKKSYYLSIYPDLKITGEWGQTYCKSNGHKDNNPSLFVNLINGSYHCKGCGIKGSLFDHFMMINNVDFPTAKLELAKKVGLVTEPTKKIVKTYDYVDESGKLLFQTVRCEPKDFKQRQPNGKNNWTHNLKDVRLVPYNLPEVLQAKSVIIVEGEKDVEALKVIGLIASCNPMGAGKWRPEYNQYFKGKRIAIIPDNDKPGHDHALQIAKNLKGIAESIKVVELPDLPEKGDVSDWIAQGGTKEELIDIINDTPEWIPENKRQYFIRIGDILHEETELNNEVIRDFLPDGSLCLLTAPSTHYKTWLALYIAKCVDENLPCLGRDTKYRKVYYIDKENPKSVVRAYCKKLGINENTNVELWPLWAEKEPPTFPDEVYLEIAKEKPLIIFDSQIRFYPKGTDENSASDMNPFMSFLKSLTKAGATVLILHHAGKSESSEYRGSSDILGGVDIAYTIKKSEDDPPVLTLKCIKSRFYSERDITVEVIADDTSLRFEIVQNPDIEDLKTLHDLIAEFKDSMDDLPNQSKIVDKAENDFGFKRLKTLKLLKKGEGKFWHSKQIKDKRNAKVYNPISVVQLSNTIYRQTTEQLPEKPNQLSKITRPVDTSQSLDNTELSSCQEGIQTTEKQDSEPVYINAEVE